MAEDMGDKTELPTGRRLSEARGQGRVARSQDLAAAIDLFGAFLLLLTFGGTLAKAMAVLLRASLANTGQTPDETSLVELGKLSLWQVAIAALPILGLACVIAAFAHITQFGVLWNPGAISLKWERLNPVGGLGKFANRRNIVKTGVNLGKLTVVCGVSYLYARGCMHKLIALPMLPALGAWTVIGQLTVQLAAWLFAVLIIMGLIDYLYQKWQHQQDLKMTKEEVKDERRSMEGDPKIKGKRLRMARDIIRQRIGSAVPKADVIVTNPTHFSVALQYDEDTMKAPKVIAKGADELAMSIRYIAKAHSIPIIERPPLARALFRHVEVGQEVHAQFYEAVAEVLAYVYRLEREAKARSNPAAQAVEAKPIQPLPTVQAA